MDGKLKKFPKSAQQVEAPPWAFSEPFASTWQNNNNSFLEKRIDLSDKYCLNNKTFNSKLESPLFKQQNLYLEPINTQRSSLSPLSLKGIHSSKTLLTDQSEHPSNSPNSPIIHSRNIESDLFHNETYTWTNDALLEPFRNISKLNPDDFLPHSPSLTYQPTQMNELKLVFPNPSQYESTSSSLTLIREELLQSLRKEFLHFSEEHEEAIVEDLPMSSCCSCKKSKCLQRYCECFRRKRFCSDGCSCKDCFNIYEYEDIRDQFFKEQLDRNPQSFSSKIVAFSAVRVNSKGCHCKKSSCIKNYCECFAAGVCCTELCRCVCCQNPERKLMEGIGAICERIGKKKKKSEKSFKDSLIEKLAIRKNTQEMGTSSDRLSDS